MIRTVIVTVLLSMTAVPCLVAQNRAQRRTGEQLLDYIQKDVKRFYFDTTYNGADMDALRRAAQQSMKTFRHDGEIGVIIAKFLRPLNDSHTYFIPPMFEEGFDYGFELKFFGDQLLVTAVDAGSDAARVGLKKGDAITAIDGRVLTRANYSDFAYEYQVLAPRTSLQLIVTTPDGVTRQLRVQTRVDRDWARNPRSGMLFVVRARQDEDSLRKLYRNRYAIFEKKAFVWKLPVFSYWDNKAGEMVDRALNYDAMILDLRGNPGGDVRALRDVVRRFMPAETRIATMKERTKSEELVAKPANKVFTGKLFILVDSESASAAEVFARLMQLTGRAKVIGDRTAGAVRASRTFYYDAEGVLAGASITVSDVIMPDGGLLERVGVQPNETVVLKNYNLVEGTDPVLAYALSLTGVEIDPAAAAKVYEARH